MLREDLRIQDETLVRDYLVSVQQNKGTGRGVGSECKAVAVANGVKGAPSALLCLDNLEKQNCIVYTVGVARRSGVGTLLEEDIVKKTGCTVHQFDCARSRPFLAPKNVVVHQNCIGAKSELKGRRVYHSLSRTMARLHHRKVDLLYIDADYEIESSRILSSFSEAAPAQVIFWGKAGCAGENDLLTKAEAQGFRTWASLSKPRKGLSGIGSQCGLIRKIEALEQSKTDSQVELEGLNLADVDYDFVGNSLEVYTRTFNAFKAEHQKCRRMQRIGNAGDGGKEVCMDHFKTTGCVVYSLGSNLDFSFEVAVLQMSSCTIHTFDCTVGNPRKVPKGVNFHPWCLGSSDAIIDGHQFYTLGTIMRKLGTPVVDLLKMDIEGFEIDVINSFSKVVPVQIVFEAHVVMESA